MSSLQSIYPCLGSPSCPLGVSQGTVPAPVKLPSTTSPGFEPGRPLTPHDTVRGTDGKGTAQRNPSPHAGNVTAFTLDWGRGPAPSSQGEAAYQQQKPDLGLGHPATRLLDWTTGPHRPLSAAVRLASSRPGQARSSGIWPMGSTA